MRSELKTTPGERPYLKGIRKTIRENKRTEAEARNRKTPIHKRSRKTNAWKQFIPVDKSNR